VNVYVAMSLDLEPGSEQ